MLWLPYHWTYLVHIVVFFFNTPILTLQRIQKLMQWRIAAIGLTFLYLSISKVSRLESSCRNWPVSLLFGRALRVAYGGRLQRRHFRLDFTSKLYSSRRGSPIDRCVDKNNFQDTMILSFYILPQFLVTLGRCFQQPIYHDNHRSQAFVSLIFFSLSVPSCALLIGRPDARLFLIWLTAVLVWHVFSLALCQFDLPQWGIGWDWGIHASFLNVLMSANFSEVLFFLFQG